ncbi:hypothetical protein P280DRAFT_470677 [Massarina eburnea CBS 473.64]|uniref:Uncharacterized protein n=1 Tax=Massarina eburnea CBS 473.64 TaxID=1395130 RepID=A0A6A6RVX3_9PLEO|nr:hypothetical protein P280DRAFT_470677 [Massarina eburnea CBS 473.64]
MATEPSHTLFEAINDYYAHKLDLNHLIGKQNHDTKTTTLSINPKMPHHPAEENAVGGTKPQHPAPSTPFPFPTLREGSNIP